MTDYEIVKTIDLSDRVPKFDNSICDYEIAKELGLTNKNRWEEGIDHHPMSIRIMQFLTEHDFVDYNDFFCWKTGGDGDNGETLMYQMDAFFEMQDELKNIDTKR